MIAKTDSRSLLGTLNDFAFMLEWQLREEPAADLVQTALELSHTPVRPLGRLGFPDGGDEGAAGVGSKGRGRVTDELSGLGRRPCLQRRTRAPDREARHALLPGRPPDRGSV